VQQFARPEEHPLARLAMLPAEEVLCLLAQPVAQRVVREQPEAGPALRQEAALQVKVLRLAMLPAEESLCRLARQEAQQVCRERRAVDPVRQAVALRARPASLMVVARPAFRGP
jgi:hypothetical protein